MCVTKLWRQDIIIPLNKKLIGFFKHLDFFFQFNYFMVNARIRNSTFLVFNEKCFLNFLNNIRKYSEHISNIFSDGVISDIGDDFFSIISIHNLRIQYSQIRDYSCRLFSIHRRIEHEKQLILMDILSFQKLNQITSKLLSPLLFDKKQNRRMCKVSVCQFFSTFNRLRAD